MLLALRIACGAAAFVVLCLSIGLNVAYWWQQMAADPVLRTIYVTLSVTAGVLKCFLLVIIQRTGGFSANKGLAAVFAVAFAYDIWSGIGFSNMSRAAAGREEHAAAIARGNLRAEMSKAQSKLQQLPASRPKAIIDPELTAAKALAGPCKSQVDAAKEACRNVAKLNVELAAATERETLEGQIALATMKLNEKGEARDADPQVTAAVEWFASIGFEVPRMWVVGVQTALFLLFLEIVPPLAFGGAFRPSTPAPVQVTHSTTHSAGPPVAGPIAPRPARPRVAKLTATDVLTAISNNPKASQADLAAALGSSKTTVNRRVKELQAAGQLPAGYLIN